MTSERQRIGLIDVARVKLIVAAESLRRPLRYENSPVASIEEADRLDNEGRWESAARMYHQLAAESDSPVQQATLLLEQSQMLTNLGRFGESRQTIDQAANVLAAETNMGEQEHDALTAALLVKQAWIYDYEGNFSASIANLTRAGELHVKYPEQLWTAKMSEVERTRVHFLGRAHLGMALFGRNRDSNIGLAQTYFETDRQMYAAMRPDSPKPVNEWFNEAWLVRCSIAKGEFNKAHEQLLHSKRLLDEDRASGSQDTGVWAHYHILEAGILLSMDKPDDAMGAAVQALAIRETQMQENRGYPKGLADAHSAMAGIEFYRHRYGRCAYHIVKAVQVFPGIIARPMM